jgi:hypothetical protein
MTSWKRRNSRTFLFGLWGLVLAGCGGPGLNAALDYGDTPLSLDSLVTVVNQRSKALRSIKGSADLVVQSPQLGRPRTLQVSLVAERPDRARIRGRAGALVSVFDLASDGDSLKLYLPRDRAVVIESLREGRAMPVLASRELVPALLQHEIRREMVDPDSGFSRKGGGYELVLEEKDSAGAVTRRRLFYEKDRLRLVHQTIEREEGGRTRIALVQYLGHRWKNGAWFPMRVGLIIPETRERLELRFVDSVTLNADIDPALFVLQVPPKTRRVNAEDLDDSFLGEAPEAATPR